MTEPGRADADRPMGRGRFMLRAVARDLGAYFLAPAATIPIALGIENDAVRFVVVWLNACALIYALLAAPRAWFAWESAAASVVLRGRTVHAPRFEGALPTERRRRAARVVKRPRRP